MCWLLAQEEACGCGTGGPYSLRLQIIKGMGRALGTRAPSTGILPLGWEVRAARLYRASRLLPAARRPCRSVQGGAIKKTGSDVPLACPKNYDD